MATEASRFVTVSAESHLQVKRLQQMAHFSGKSSRILMNYDKSSIIHCSIVSKDCLWQ